MRDGDKSKEQLIAELAQLRARMEAREQDSGDQLRRQQDFTRGITNSLGEGICALDADGNVTFVNSAAERMLGWTEAELLSKPLFQLIHFHRDPSHDPSHDPSRERVCTPLEPQSRRRGPRRTTSVTGDTGETTLTRRDGTTFPVSYVSATIPSGDQTVGTVLSFHDISTRRTAEASVALQFAVSRVLTQFSSLPQAAPNVLRVVGEALECSLGALWIVAPDAEALRCAAVWRASATGGTEFERESQTLTLRRGEDLPGRVWQTGDPLWLFDVMHESDFPRLWSAAREGLQSALAFPVRGEQGILGVIEFFTRTVREPDAALLQATAVVGNQVGQFIERERAEAAVRASDAYKSAILATALDAIVSIDRAGRISDFNAAAERTFGYRREDVIGRDMGELLIPPSLRAAHYAGFARYLETGQAHILGQRREFPAFRADGAEFPIELAVTRVERDGEATFTAYIRDITERRQAEDMRARASQQAALRADISLALTGTGSLDEMLRRCVVALAKHLAVADARIWLLNEADDTLTLRASAGLAGMATHPREPTHEQPNDLSSRVTLGADRPGHTSHTGNTGHLGRIVRDRAPYYTNDAPHDARFDDADWARREGLVAFAGYPLSVGDSVVGVMALFSRHALAADMLDMLSSIADVVAQGVVRKHGEEERRRLLERERAARHEAEDAQRRLQFLGEASILLASSLDYAATLSQVVRLAVPHIADWCYVDLLDEDGAVQRLEVAHVDPAARAMLEEMRRRYPPPPEHPVSRVLRTGTAELVEHVPDELLARVSPDSHVLETMRSFAIRSYMALPIRGRDRTLGALMFVTVSASGRRYGPEDFKVGEELARRAALAIENAQLYQRTETVLRQAEQIARQQREQAAELAAVIEAMPDGVFACDRDGIVVRSNAKGAAMLGLRPDQIHASPDDYSALTHLSDADGRIVPPVEYPRVKALRGETVSERYFMRRHDNGEERQIRSSAAPIRDAAGAITGAVIVVSDITEVYRLERQKDEFLSIASHELKTPLTTLKILTQLTHKRLVKAGALEAEQTLRMERAIGRMERLVNDLLDVSRLDSGKIALRTERFDLVALCRQVAEEQMAASDRPVALNLPAAPVEVEADPDRISQVLTNLISNALKYSAERSAVSLRLARQSEPADTVTVAVHDAGAGIPPDALPHLFERFYRVPGVQVQSGSGVGLGLGLYISKEIVERHGGHIWAESAVGAGSTFSFTLPISADTGPAPAGG